MEKAFVYGMSVEGVNFTDRIKKALLEREIITVNKDGMFLADSVFGTWFKRECM